MVVCLVTCTESPFSLRLDNEDDASLWIVCTGRSKLSRSNSNVISFCMYHSGKNAMLTVMVLL